MHEAAGMHLISTCTGNEVGSSYVLAFGSWITFVSCNALGVTLHIGIGDRTMDNGKQLIILVMMIIDSYQRLVLCQNLACYPNCPLVFVPCGLVS